MTSSTVAAASEVFRKCYQQSEVVDFLFSMEDLFNGSATDGVVTASYVHAGPNPAIFNGGGGNGGFDGSRGQITQIHEGAISEATANINTFTFDRAVNISLQIQSINPSEFVRLHPGYTVTDSAGAGLSIDPATDIATSTANQASVVIEYQNVTELEFLSWGTGNPNFGFNFRNFDVDAIISDEFEVVCYDDGSFARVDVQNKTLATISQADIDGFEPCDESSSIALPQTLSF